MEVITFWGALERRLLRRAESLAEAAHYAIEANLSLNRTVEEAEVVAPNGIRHCGLRLHQIHVDCPLCAAGTVL